MDLRLEMLSDKSERIHRSAFGLSRRGVRVNDKQTKSLRSNLAWRAIALKCDYGEFPWVIKMVTKERRADVRGDFTFQIKYKIMTTEEFEDLKRFDEEIFSSSNKGHSVDIIASEISTESTANAALISYILQIDEKLDQILELLSKDGSAAVPFRPGFGQNISGSGMQIVIEHPVESGQIINAKFFLSKRPLVFMDIFGKVIRLIREDEDGRVLYKVGIKFLDLNISDRERIIASVFQRQREILRKSKSKS